MKLLLDTDTCIELIRGRSDAVLRRLKRYSPGDVGISSITFAELSYGVVRSSQQERNQSALDRFVTPLDVVPFDASAAGMYGRLRSELESKGKTIGAFDLLIAAHALSLSLPLVTHNTREFSRVEGLRLADWIPS
jgi:tRNA(fMet)-specific endonuclease VapC